MPSLTPIVRRSVLAGLVLGLAMVPPVTAQRRAAAAKPQLTEETLAPTELFPEVDAKRFSYPLALEVLYTHTENGHHWKLSERPMSLDAASPSPSPSPSASPDPAEPAPETPDQDFSLDPTAQEEQFTNRVGLIRPTFVTLVFTESPAAAKEQVAAFLAAKQDETTRPQNLAVFAIDADTKTAPGGVLYNREYNLGAKSGGVRRASMLLVAKGSILLKVDAALGLRDGTYEAEFDTLEKRARSVASYVLGKL